MGKNMTTYWRHPNYNLIRMITTILIAVIFGSLYWNVGSDRYARTAEFAATWCLDLFLNGSGLAATKRKFESFKRLLVCKIRWLKCDSSSRSMVLDLHAGARVALLNSCRSPIIPH